MNLPRNLSEWEFTPDGEAITRTFTFVDFLAVIRIVQKIAEIAEAEDHHPDMHIHDWNKLTVVFSTHSARSVTEKDFSLAEKVNTLIP